MEPTDKPRLVHVTDPGELAAIMATPDLGRPFLHDGGYVDAVELEKWRAGLARTET